MFSEVMILPNSVILTRLSHLRYNNYVPLNVMHYLYLYYENREKNF
jgi:hypothetical protein